MDIVARQVQAYNQRDLEAFVACYTSDALVETEVDGDSQVIRGHDAIRSLYGQCFEASPELYCEVKSQLQVGSYMVYEEYITGINLEGFPATLHGVVVYRVEAEKISYCHFYST